MQLQISDYDWSFDKNTDPFRTSRYVPIYQPTELKISSVLLVS